MKWTKKPLSEVADFYLGKMLDEKKNRGEYLPYLANVNVRWGEFDLENLREMRFEHDEYVQYSLKYGDIVMCEGGEPGRCAIWKDQIPGMMIQKAIHRIRAFDCIEQRFLFYFFLHQGRAGKFAPLFTGSTIKHLPRQNLAKVEIEFPPLEIQYRISEILSNYDELIENNTRQIQLLEEAVRQLYKEWFVRLRFPGHEQIKVVDGVPAGWVRVYMPDIIDINPRASALKDTLISYVPMSSLSENRMTIDQSGFERRANHTSVKFQNNDVLLARITPCLENGKTGFVDFLSENEVACGSTEFIVLRGKKVSPYFTYCLARTRDFRENAIKSMIGSSGRQRVQSSCFHEFMVPLPPESFLNEFDEFAQPCFDQIKVLSQQSKKLCQARDLLLPRLMSGEIRV